MLTKPSLKLLVFSAVALAQGMPGTQYICNKVKPNYCLHLDYVVTEPGQQIFLFALEMWYGQRWIFDVNGYLWNQYSGLVLEAPVSDEGIILDSPLYMATQVAGRLNQQWEYDSQNRLISKYNKNTAVTGKNGVVAKEFTPAVMEVANDSQNQQWDFTNALDYQFNSCSPVTRECQQPWLWEGQSKQNVLGMEENRLRVQL